MTTFQLAKARVFGFVTVVSHFVWAWVAGHAARFEQKVVHTAFWARITTPEAIVRIRLFGVIPLTVLVCGGVIGGLTAVICGPQTSLRLIVGALGFGLVVGIKMTNDALPGRYWGSQRDRVVLSGGVMNSAVAVIGQWLAIGLIWGLWPW